MTTTPDSMDWDVVVDRLGAGKLMPVLSNRVVLDLLFQDSRLYDRLVRQCAKDVYRYDWGRQGRNDSDEPKTSEPGEIENLLVRAAQYYTVCSGWKSSQAKTKYVRFVIQQLWEQVDTIYSSNQEAEAPLPPDRRNRIVESLDQRRSVAELVMNECAYGAYVHDLASNPLCRMLELNIPIYLTTGYFEFLQCALASDKFKRTPKTMTFCWKDSLIGEIPKDERTASPDWNPNKEQPLVYHFYGLDKYPASMVLTEDDHLEFLENWLQNFNDQNRTPECIRTAICSDAYPVLLGYDLYSWDLRTLWRILLKHKSASYGGCAIQLDPYNMNQWGQAFVEDLRRFLESHFKNAQLDIVWATPDEFIEELCTRVGR